MGLFQKKIGPVFLKEDSDASSYIVKMQELEEKVVDSELKSEIKKQIKIASIGELGEKNISFELKNSGMDMYILHDIYLEYEGLSAQIDYLVITRKRIFVIECKNLIGNIEIDNQGNFIRTYELFGKKIKEGVYSPVTQNQRHLEVLKNVRKEAKGNMLTKAVFEKFFDESYKSLIVLANPKTYLNAKFAKKEVKDKVIRADQIINFIKESNAACKDPNMSEKDMLQLAQFYLTANKAERSDYSKKYEEMVDAVEKSKEQSKAKSQENVQVNGNTDTKKCPKCGANLILRTATKGNNVGKRFYGCSAFPKCRYIQNI